MNETIKKITKDFIVNIIIAFVIIMIFILCIFIFKQFSELVFREPEKVTNSIITEENYDAPLTPLEEFTIIVDEEILSETSDSIILEVPNTYENLGRFKLTAYCPCVKCCDKWGENRPVDENGDTIVYTASGKIAEQGRTIAADTNVLPFGTIIYINGEEYEVQDRGGAIKNKRIDIYFDNHQEALNFGVQYAEVFVADNV